MNFNFDLADTVARITALILLENGYNWINVKRPNVQVRPESLLGVTFLPSRSGSASASVSARPLAK